jgi:lysophospholipase L1-like esterase
MYRRSLAIAALAVVATTVVGGCGTTPETASPSAGARPRAAVATDGSEMIVAIGSGATVGAGLDERFQDAWPRLVHRDAFPRAAVLVNAAVERSSADDAVREQVPLVEELTPAVVMVWLGMVEAFDQRPPADLGEVLTEIVRRSRATSARVLLADLPAAPGVDVAPYNRVIAAVAQNEDATLVALHELDVSRLPGRTLSLLPDRDGHRTIARAFADAL